MGEEEVRMGRGKGVTWGEGKGGRRGGEAGREGEGGLRVWRIKHRWVVNGTVAGIAGNLTGQNKERFSLWSATVQAKEITKGVGLGNNNTGNERRSHIKRKTPQPL